MSKKEHNDLSYLKLSIMTAILNEIPPKLRAVTVSIDKEAGSIKGMFYFHGEISENDVESVSLTETRVISDLAEISFIEFRPIRYDYPQKPKILRNGCWVYIRREEYPEDII